MASNIWADKWVFKTKDALSNTENKIITFRTRLATLDFLQILGLDYDETFALVIKFSALRSFFAIGANKYSELHQMDVKTLFLNRELKEDF